MTESRSRALIVVLVVGAWVALRVLQIALPKTHPWWVAVEVVRWATLLVGVAWGASRYMRLEERTRMNEYRLRRIAEEAELLRIDFDLDQVAKQHERDEPDVIV